MEENRRRTAEVALPVSLCWVREGRFYRLHADRDLFGDVVLVRTWGGGGRPTVVRKALVPDGCLHRIVARTRASRRRQGYRLVERT